MEGQSYTISKRFLLSFYASSNRVLNKSFDSTIYIMMLTKTRDGFSLALYLADAASYTICVIVQDGFDLITMVLEGRVPLRLLASLLFLSLILFYET